MTDLDEEERLKYALYFGRRDEVAELIGRNPDLGRANFGLMCALYDAEGVEMALSADPGLANRAIGPRKPILHLAFSRHLHGAGSEADMLAVGRALISAGANPDEAYAADPDSDHKLSALYGAIGHADNPVLGRLLLEAGANPNDNESLYHSTEQSHSYSLRLLLEFGADPKGTNALLRALDFNNAEMVAMLLAGGADPNEGAVPHPSGEPAMVVNALHQAARRMCGAEVADILIASGAELNAAYQGIRPYALARAHGNHEVAGSLKTAGSRIDLSETELLLAAAADGESHPDDFLDEGTLVPEFRRLLCRIAGREGAMGHIRRLVALGLDPDRTDEMGMPPAHISGWEGLADHLAYFLTFAPDTELQNAYGGTLLTTILHGAENAPRRDGRDYAACLRLAVEAGAIVGEDVLNWPMEPELRSVLVS